MEDTRQRLSVLAKGRGLLDGGVEIECIPDYRHNHSLSGDVFLTQSPTTSGKHAKVYKSYSLSLPKTYVTRRGQMMLFTSPDDMIIGRGLQCAQKERVNELSRGVLKGLKTTEKLRESTENYEVSDGSAEDVKPGHFTSVYLKTLRSVQAAAITDDLEANSPPLVSTTDVHLSFSGADDSGIDSSTSHQTIANTISGRTSSFSNRTDSSTVVIPPNTSEDASSHGVSPSELTDIMLTLPKPLPSKSVTTIVKKKPSGNSKRSIKKTTKKKSAKAKSVNKPSVNDISSKPSNDEQKQMKQLHETPATNTTVSGTVSHISSGGSSTTGTTKKKGKVKKLKRKKNNNDEIFMNSIPSEDDQCEPDDDNDYGSCTVISTGTTETNKKTSNEDRKALMAARANERRLLIEKKRMELEEIKISKQLEEEKNRLLKEQLINPSNEPITIDNEEVQTPLVDIQPVEQRVTIPEVTSNDDTDHHHNCRMDSSQPAVDNKLKLLAALQEKKEKFKTTASVDGTTEIKQKSKTVYSASRHKPIVQPDMVKLKENKIDYRSQLGALAANTVHTQRMKGYFSYFSYLPTTKSQSEKKKNVKKKKK